MGNNSTDHLLRLDEHFLVKPGSKVDLKSYDTSYTSSFKDKEEAREMLEKDIERLTKLQDMLYAQDRHSVLIVFQAMDGAGKDSTIKHVMSGVNPQGCNVSSFKQPNDVELKHDFLWRINREVPRKGMIKIFNRSHYEEVLVTRVHPEYVLKQNLPGIDSVDKIDKDFWNERYKQINNFEKLLAESGTVIIKFFLYVSRDEQKKRFLERIDKPEKNWKFSSADVAERQNWKQYMKAYEEAISATSKDYAPWYIIPADKKWFMRTAVGDIIVGTMEQMDLHYPKVSKNNFMELEKAKNILMSEP
jgi:PPK2 family polyphosphate:nucleotide phosphotransferase